MKISNFDLEKWYVEFEFKSKYNLSASGIKPLNFNELKDIQELNDITLTYTPAHGDDELIKLIAKKNNVDKSNVLITNGAIEALFITQLSLFEKGDNVIVQKPTYPALYKVLENLNVNIIDWRLEFNESYNPNINKLNTLMEEYKPKALIINFPNNPTGADLNQEEKSLIIDLCKKYDSYLISDEVYSKLSLENTGIFKDYSKKITIDSLSKTYGLAGLRIGWVIAEQNIIDKLMNTRLYMTLCNNAISQKIALNILKNSESYISKNLALLDKNKKITLEYLDKLKNLGLIDYIPPISGLTIFVKVNITNDIESFSRDFEDKTSILLLPANRYEKQYNNFFRLGFGIDTEILKYCLDKFSEYIIKLRL